MDNSPAKPFLCSLSGGFCRGEGLGLVLAEGTEDKDLFWVFPHSGLSVLVLGQRQSPVLVFVGMFLLQ